MAIGSSDTVAYCIGGPQSLSSYTAGVKIPASALSPSKQLTHVLFYAYESATYTVTVYTGSNHENTAAVASLTVNEGEQDAWHTVALDNPVAATADMWIMISSNDATYPVTLTSYSGVPSSLLLDVNGEFWEYGANWGKSAMIKGVFGSEAEINGDTVSYCGNDSMVESYGTGGGALEWGIMLPPTSFGGAGYLKSAMISLAHTQTVNFGSSQTGWQEVFIDTTFALDNQNLWITFATNVQTYPMAVCNYTGSSNSDWFYYDGVWQHFGDIGLEFSWMIKAVMTSTAPTLPPPTVTIVGQSQLAKVCLVPRLPRLPVAVSPQCGTPPVTIILLQTSATQTVAVPTP